MKKGILLLLAILLLPCLFFYGWFAITTGEHHYLRTDLFSYWLYTPDRLKRVPIISGNAEYRYDYDPDNHHTIVVIYWKNIENIALKKIQLTEFIKTPGGFGQYDCQWIYRDENDYSDNYQRYCVYQKGETLELEFFETET